MDINHDMTDTNRARLSGVLITDPVFSHRTYGESFYETLIGIERSSGYTDKIRLQISERLMFGMNISAGTAVEIKGQVRTYNEERCGHSRLNIMVFARELNVLEEKKPVNCINEIELTGYICKEPVKRTSPLGREICDIMLAVNRMYNKSDYIPCIAWGRNASYSSALSVGDELIITGRIQSREYRKKDDNGNIISKVAYEVSIVRIEGHI